MQRLAFLVVVAVALLALGCGKRVQFYAPPAQLANGVYVKVLKAQARGERIYVETYVTNNSGKAIRVDRDAWTLRLPTGEVLPRSIGRTTTHDLYTLEPNQGREVHIDFKKEGHELSAIGSAQLIVGGIWFGDDPNPQIVGEIPMSTTPLSQQLDAPPPLTGPPDESPSGPPNAPADSSAEPEPAAPPASASASPPPDASSQPEAPPTEEPPTEEPAADKAPPDKTDKDTAPPSD